MGAGQDVAAEGRGIGIEDVEGAKGREGGG